MNDKMENITNVSIKDFKKFKLISPKGKIINSTIHNAYNKKALSSIPNGVEVFLFDTNKEKDELLFNKINNLINKHKKLKNLTSEKTRTKSSINLSNYQKENLFKTKSQITQNDKNQLNKTKSYNYLFKNNEERFSEMNKKEFIDKYLPGPGQYEINNKLNNNSNIRYNSLFIPSNTTKERNTLINNGIPGPGTYDILNYEEKKNCIVKMDSKLKRFKDFKKEIVGPGSYFPNNLIKYNDFNWSKKIPSSFFKNNISFCSDNVKKENLLRKYINIHKQEIISPGPGEYNLKSNFDYKCLSDRIVKRKNNYLISDKIREEYHNSLLIEELIMKNKINEYNNNNRKKIKYENSSKNIRSPFLSKVERLVIYPKKHVPGPCYYGNEKINKI